MDGLRKVVPTAYEDLRDNVYTKYSVVDVEVLKKRPTGAQYLWADDDLKDFRDSLMDWQERWNLVSTEGKEYANEYVADYALMLCYSWLINSEHLADLAPFPQYTIRFVGKSKVTMRQPAKPPVFLSADTVESYLKRARKYAEKESIIHEKRDYSIEELGRLGIIKFSDNIRLPRLWKSEFYQWAAYYQCEPGASLGRSACRFQIMDETEFLLHVKRVLKACYLRPREPRAGPKPKTIKSK